MTTTISLPTRDCIVIGCDSLATSTQAYLDPHRISEAFFDKEGRLKLTPDGQPALDDVRKLFAYADYLPRNQLPNVTKIFSLNPYKAGLLFAGISGIGKHSIRALVEQFVKNNKTKHPPNSVVLGDLAESLLEFLDSQFDTEMNQVPRENRPKMEVILSGYSEHTRIPLVFKLTIGPEKECKAVSDDGGFRIVFGGQHDVIQRVVNGVDFDSYCNLLDRHEAILAQYRDTITGWAKSKGLDEEVPVPDFSEEKMQLFGGNFGGVRGILPDHGNLSEQAAINFVEFLVKTMINAQEFSERIPTVGGDVHVALITPENGFKWISKEEFNFQDHSVPRYE